jgi:hypothetical protein
MIKRVLGAHNVGPKKRYSTIVYLDGPWEKRDSCLVTGDITHEKSQ